MRPRRFTLLSGTALRISTVLTVRPTRPRAKHRKDPGFTSYAWHAFETPAAFDHAFLIQQSHVVSGVSGTDAIIEDFAPVFERAIKSAGLALVGLRTDPDAISTRTTITSLRKRAPAS